MFSGLPSTVHALATGGDPLAATRAAGSLLLPEEERTGPLLIAAAAAHGVLSLGWGVVLACLLPGRRTWAWGALGGLGIAALDLGVIGRRYPQVSALAISPQVADHVAYGAIVGIVLEHRRSR
ncbi:MAG: hypothetical protein ACRDJI_03340 [Actinomycetota bacterium]